VVVDLEGVFRKLKGHRVKIVVAAPGEDGTGEIEGVLREVFDRLLQIERSNCWGYKSMLWLNCHTVMILSIEDFGVVVGR